MKTTKDIGKAYLMDALHHQALETSAAVASLFLLIQVSFGSAELLRIQERAYAALEDGK